MTHADTSDDTATEGATPAVELHDLPPDPGRRPLLTPASDADLTPAPYTESGRQ